MHVSKTGLLSIYTAFFSFDYSTAGKGATALSSMVLHGALAGHYILIPSVYTTISFFYVTAIFTFSSCGNWHNSIPKVSWINGCHSNMKTRVRFCVEANFSSSVTEDC